MDAFRPKLFDEPELFRADDFVFTEEMGAFFFTMNYYT